MSPSVDVGITVFAKPIRLARLLETGVHLDMIVFEDPSSEEIAATYSQLCGKYGIPYRRSPQWGCMQGIIQYAVKNTDREWFVYVPDDLLPTPHALSRFLDWLEVLPSHVGAVQMPYWNYDQLRTLSRWEQRDNLFQESPDWLASVPLNPHWWGPAFYLNVNGAGFALRRKAWEAAGGFSQQTWCLDEDISCRIWLKTEYTIMSVPGPPWVHQGGGSTSDQHKFGHAHLRHATIDGWLDAWGEGKDEIGARCRAVMAERGKQYGYPVR